MNEWRKRKDMFTVMKENFSYKVDLDKMHPEEHLEIQDDETSAKKFKVRRYRAILRLSLIFIAILLFLVIFVDVMNSLV